MDSKHYLCLGAGILIGWLVVPMVLGVFAKKAA